jgi:hypothetical protein
VGSLSCACFFSFVFLPQTFASTKTAFEVKINIGKKYQANDESDLEYSTVFESLQKL